LRIDISVVPEMSLADACTILRIAATFPVRLTLLRQRHEPQSEVNDLSTVVDVEQDQSGGNSSRLEYVVVGGPESSWTSSPEYQEPPMAGQPSRRRSEEPTGGQAPEMVVSERFHGRQRSQSSDDVSRELPPMLVGSASGAAGVHSTYIDLSAVVPHAQSSASGEWNNDSTASAFFKTQSSPTLDKTPDLSTTSPAKSSTQRLAQSVDELYTYVRRIDSSDIQERVDLERNAAAPSSLSAAVETVDATYANEEEFDTDNLALDASSHYEGPDEELENHHLYYNVSDNNDRGLTNGKVKPVLPTPLFAEHNKGAPTNTTEPAYINHSNVYLQQASAAGLHGSQPLRTAVKDADLDGVEKALRAPERSATGGLAYYINLEDHHFSGFPGRRTDGRYHSADDLRTS